MSWVAHETAVQTKRVNMVGVPQLRCLPSVMPIIRLCRPSERAALLSIAPELSERTNERTSLVVRQRRRRRRGGRQPRLPFRPPAEPGGGRPAQTNRRASGPRRSTQSVGLSPLPEPPRRTHSGGRGRSDRSATPPRILWQRVAFVVSEGRGKGAADTSVLTTERAFSTAVPQCLYSPLFPFPSPRTE